ncbi:muscular LMNA-interacting protein isoform X4 [Dipodomys merriami]|uniref:muscular LMNA-interacting protein isoform X4 n=1 Tax=Dipodomys merriami TaxID=94247 RepID=UPI00384FA6DF
MVCSADGDAKPLIFTFVPTLRRLPTHTRCVDTSQFLVRIPGDHSPETVNRPCPAAALSPSPAVQRDSAPGRCVPSMALEARGMQLGDVFQARCVLIVDSEGEDEAPDPTLPGPLPRASSDVVRPKAPGPRPNAPGPTPKQLASPTACAQPARRAPAAASVSPTNQTAAVPASALGEARAPRGASSALPHPDSTQRPGSRVPAPGLVPHAPTTTAATAATGVPSYIPVRIVTHPLSPSPRPFPAALPGSASGSSRVSSPGSLSAAGARGAAPSRLSLLTAILRSGPAQPRPRSPASCPSLSPGSLGSSTLTLHPPGPPAPRAPRKSLSSSALSALPPERTPQPPGRDLASADAEPAPLPAPGCTPPASPPHPRPGDPAARASPALPSPTRDPEQPEDLPTCPSASAPTPPRPAHPPCGLDPALPAPDTAVLPSPALSGLLDRSQAPSTPRAPGAGPGSASASPPSLGSPPPTTGPSSSWSPGAPALHTLPSKSGGPAGPVCGPRAPGPGPTAPGPLWRGPKPAPPRAPAPATGPENKKPQPYKITSSYKAFAAIPTNTLLLEQKALDEPIRTENVSKDSVLGLPVELCSPAQLRQQTEAVCAAIDKVLRDSLSMHSPDSPSKSLKIMLGSETIKTPTTVPRAAGRETKYANLSSASSGVSENQLTKPGVIRPVPVKSRILLKNEEEVYEPNPFSKYLEDSRNLFSGQGLTVPPRRVSLHPLYQTKLYPPAKSLLRPAPPSGADCLTPGPFSHLSSSSLRDERQSPHLLLGLGAYHKPSHAMVAIPEHETLASKEQ